MGGSCQSVRCLEFLFQRWWQVPLYDHGQEWLRQVEESVIGNARLSSQCLLAPNPPSVLPLVMLGFCKSSLLCQMALCYSLPPLGESRERERAKLEGGGSVCYFLSVSCFYHYYPSSVSSLGQQCPPIADSEFSLSFSYSCRTSFIEPTSEILTSAKQCCSSEVCASALQGFLLGSNFFFFNHPSPLPSLHPSPRDGGYLLQLLSLWHLSVLFLPSQLLC